ncbi:uncharacterized protein RHO25_001576 [Cercospora beticola]|uniref:Major facilitator superfamily (MFS) profile domain-containing protein n=1 Tax=Cercospora beticola TaxID=122368 RepID=A0ABZ0NBT4_CERBT|nr:hypothetical protein RHO25_001576 [Cercospora beticola]CAK1354643.1 unnamed protein product [Cercospora beticola]
MAEKSANVSVQAASVLHESTLISSSSEQRTTHYASGIKLVLTTVGLGLTIFCIALDSTIIATAIPSITDDFSSINDIGWYGSAYFLTTCGFQLLFGKLYTFFSLKVVFVVALSLFEIGSAICGAAPTSTTFIIGRAIAGCGCAGLFSGALLIIADTVPLRSRPTYTGLLGSAYGIACIIGPLLGGVFTDKLSWRWCFWINLPVGVVTAVFIILCYRPATNAANVLPRGWKQAALQFDPLGTLAFLAMVVCLVLALQLGGTRYAWSNGRVVALLVVFAACLIAFVLLQARGGSGTTIPLQICTQRTVVASALFSFFVGGSFFIPVYFIPVWFQAVRGTSAFSSAIRIIPLLLSLIVMCILSGSLTTLFGYYTPLLWLSAVLLSIGAGLLSTWEVDSSRTVWIWYQILFGLGAGAGLQLPLMAVQNVLPEDLMPIGTAMIMFSQTFGGGISVSAAQNVFTNLLLEELDPIFPSLDRSIILSSGVTNVQELVPDNLLHAVRLACNTATTTTFVISIVMACLAAPAALAIEWRSMKRSNI